MEWREGSREGGNAAINVSLEFVRVKPDSEFESDD